MNMSNTHNQALWLSVRNSSAENYCRYRSLSKFVVIIALLLGLSGCFKSSRELISAVEADFPFTAITYIQNGGDKKITLNRVDDRYLNAKEGEQDYLRFKAIDENTYIVQVTIVDSKAPTYLFGLVRVSVDRKSFEVIKGIAQAIDLAATRKGQLGLKPCGDGDVCIATLKDYIAYAREAPPADSSSRFQILALKR